MDTLPAAGRLEIYSKSITDRLVFLIKFFYFILFSTNQIYQGLFKYHFWIYVRYTSGAYDGLMKRRTAGFLMMNDCGTMETCKKIFGEVVN